MALMDFVKKHCVKIIIGVFLFTITFGGYGLYKLCKSKKGS